MIRRSTALFQERHRIADRKPGLAGAGGPFGEDELVRLERLDIGVLRRVAGAHRSAPARGDLVEGGQARNRRLFGGGKEAALQRAFLDRAVHIAGPSAPPWRARS